MKHFEKYAAFYLAGAASTVSALTGAGVIPESQLKYWVAVGSIIGVWKGILEQVRGNRTPPAA
jgi:hypothetical protein